MKTIKVIDLLNKIANGENVPEKIEFEHSIYTYFKEQEDYINYADEDNKWYGQTLLFAIMLNHKISEILDTTVEIIEEDKDINIQNIKEVPEYLHIGDGKKDKDIKDETNIKINELIKAIKKLDKEMKNND